MNDFFAAPLTTGLRRAAKGRPLGRASTPNASGRFSDPIEVVVAISEPGPADVGANVEAGPVR